MAHCDLLPRKPRANIKPYIHDSMKVPCPTPLALTNPYTRRKQFPTDACQPGVPPALKLLRFRAVIRDGDREEAAPFYPMRFDVKANGFYGPKVRPGRDSSV
jgi:hypothetical protein